MIYPFQRSLICGRVSQPVNIKALRKKSFFFPFFPTSNINFQPTKCYFSSPCFQPSEPEINGLGSTDDPD